MRTEEQIKADARPGKAFSNGTEWSIWSDRWCDRCKNNDEAAELWCPIITVALIEPLTPAEWTEGTSEGEHPYTFVDTCTEFDERRDDGTDDEPEPEPVPECDGQLDIIDAFLPTALDELQKAPVTT
jgi:hypothetical protein